ncbi:MAG: hypothetical protein ACOZBL_03870 [Patescibacteria group bacterium]
MVIAYHVTTLILTPRVFDTICARVVFQNPLSPEKSICHNVLSLFCELFMADLSTFLISCCHIKSSKDSGL